MSSWPILSITTFLPVLGVLFIFTLNGDEEYAKRNARWTALWTTLVTFAVSLLLVWRFDPASLARTQEPLYRFLLNKWYFDELYDLIFVRPALWLGRVLWKGGDGFVIDGFGPDGVSARVLDVTRNVVRLQTGYLYHYAFAMLIGIAALITWFMFAGSH